MVLIGYILLCRLVSQPASPIVFVGLIICSSMLLSLIICIHQIFSGMVKRRKESKAIDYDV
jgi:hypothetical protein